MRAIRLLRGVLLRVFSGRSIALGSRRWSKYRLPQSEIRHVDTEKSISTANGHALPPRDHRSPTTPHRRGDGHGALGRRKCMNAAVDSARTRSTSWSQEPAAKRAEYLGKISAGLMARVDELAKTIARMSACRSRGHRSRRLPVMNLRNYAKMARFQVRGAGRHSLVVRDDGRVVGATRRGTTPAPDRPQGRPGARAGCTLCSSLPSSLRSTLIPAEVIHAAG